MNADTWYDPEPWQVEDDPVYDFLNEDDDPYTYHHDWPSDHPDADDIEWDDELMLAELKTEDAQWVASLKEADIEADRA